jgi:hypothetical protein
VAILTLGRFRAKCSTYAHRVTKRGPYYMLNTWLSRVIIFPHFLRTRVIMIGPFF